MVPEDTTACLKIPLKPNGETKSYFRQCCGAERYFYNQVIQHYQETHKAFSTLVACRKVIMPVKDKFLPESEAWKKQIYYDTRQLALKDAITSIKSAISNQRNGNIKKYRLGFKSKRNPNQMFNVSEKQISFKRGKIKLFVRKKLQFRISQKNQRKLSKVGITRSCRIHRDGANRWSLYIPYTRKKENVEDRSFMISLDPGVRKFQSGYDPENQQFLKFGAGTRDLLKKLHLKMDQLKSVRARGKKKYRCRIRFHKLIAKAKGIVLNLHRQLSSYLSKNYERVIVSDLNTINLLEGKLSKMVKRNLQYLSHGSFRNRLKHIYKVRGGLVSEINESYTSKTCTNCGCINDSSSSEYLTCKRCKIKLDRDLIGSRNIMLKYLQTTL